MGTSRKPRARAAPLPADIEDALASALAPQLPERERADALRHRILDRVRRERQSFLTVRATDGAWEPLAPSVAVKVLEDDGTMQTFLLRLDPGARLPAHDHPRSDELCVVMEGTVSLGGIEVSAGDYHVAFAGSTHGEIVSTTGAVLFLRTAAGTIPRR
jgi:mannose-6-phosphate isomerase-like protein (cupin superfamily)